MASSLLRNTTRPAGAKTRLQRFPKASMNSNNATSGFISKRSGCLSVEAREGCRESISTIAVGAGE